MLGGTTQIREITQGQQAPKPWDGPFCLNGNGTPNGRDFFGYRFWNNETGWWLNQPL